MSAFDVRNSLYVDGAFVAGQGRLRGYAPPPDLTGQAIAFDGGTRGLYRASALDGVSDSSKGTLSVWWRQVDAIGGGLISLVTFNDTLNGSSLPAYNDTGVAFELRNGAAFGPSTFLWDGTASNKVLFRHASFSESLLTWHHTMMSWDTDFAAASRITQVAYDGVLVGTTLSQDVGAAFNADLNQPGGVTIAGLGFNATTWQSGGTDFDLAELYLNLATHIDLSQPANIAKFRNPVTGVPVYLGATGEVPTGTAPAVYLRVAAGAAATTFATNLGTGGNFTITGTLALAATDPY